VLRAILAGVRPRTIGAERGSAFCAAKDRGLAAYHVAWR